MIILKNFFRKYGKYLISIIGTLIVGGISGAISGESMMQYEMILKPPLSPPGWLFPIVWTILYVLMGLAAGIVYSSNSNEKDTALILYTVQLAVNFFWPIFYFVFNAPLLSFFWLVFLIVLVLLTINSFSEISSKAAWLMLPYFVWLLFAAYLNLGTYILNK